MEFLEQLRENGIQIWGEGEKIRYRSKNRQLAPETLRILKMAKGQILDFFRMTGKKCDSININTNSLCCGTNGWV